MTQSNLSHSPNGAEHSAVQSVQSALNRKPLPGPRWAWPSAAALAVVGVAYLVAGTSGGHAAHRPAPSAESAPPEASSPTTTTAALQPAPPQAAAGDAPAPAPANDVAASAAKGETQGKAEAQANGEAQAKGDAAKASDDTGPAVASASTVSKKKARRAAHRGSRKRSAPAP
jgi:hypothetical protein